MYVCWKYIITEQKCKTLINTYYIIIYPLQMSTFVRIKKIIKTLCIGCKSFARPGLSRCLRQCSTWRLATWPYSHGWNSTIMFAIKSKVHYPKMVSGGEAKLHIGVSASEKQLSSWYQTRYCIATIQIEHTNNGRTFKIIHGSPGTTRNPPHGRSHPQP